MIAPQVVDEIKRLLDEGSLSQRGIARQLGVSRGTVHAIARGKRPDYHNRRGEEEDQIVPPRGPWSRCRTCGGMVQMPCLACRVRALRDASRGPASRYGWCSATSTAAPRPRPRSRWHSESRPTDR